MSVTSKSFPLKDDDVTTFNNRISVANIRSYPLKDDSATISNDILQPGLTTTTTSTSYVNKNAVSLKGSNVIRKKRSFNDSGVNHREGRALVNDTNSPKSVECVGREKVSSLYNRSANNKVSTRIHSLEDYRKRRKRRRGGNKPNSPILFSSRYNSKKTSLFFGRQKNLSDSPDSSSSGTSKSTLKDKEKEKDSVSKTKRIMGSMKNRIVFHRTIEIMNMLYKGKPKPDHSDEFYKRVFKDIKIFVRLFYNDVEDILEEYNKIIPPKYKVWSRN